MTEKDTTIKPLNQNKMKNGCSNDIKPVKTDCSKTPIINDPLRINMETHEVTYGQWQIGTLKAIIVENALGDEQRIVIGKP